MGYAVERPRTLRGEVSSGEASAKILPTSGRLDGWDSADVALLFHLHFAHVHFRRRGVLHPRYVMARQGPGGRRPLAARSNASTGWGPAIDRELGGCAPVRYDRIPLHSRHRGRRAAGRRECAAAAAALKGRRLGGEGGAGAVWGPVVGPRRCGKGEHTQRKTHSKTAHEISPQKAFLGIEASEVTRGRRRAYTCMLNLLSFVPSLADATRSPTVA